MPVLPGLLQIEKRELLLSLYTLCCVVEDVFLFALVSTFVLGKIISAKAEPQRNDQVENGVTGSVSASSRSVMQRTPLRL